MKRKFTYILATLMVIVSFTSCTDNDFMGAPSTEEGTEVYINVTISVGGNNSATRATALPNKDNLNSDIISVRDGDFADSYIDPDDVRLFVYDQEDKFVDEFNITYTSHSGETDNVTGPQDKPYQCLIQGYLKDLDEAYYHIVAVCNTKGTLKANYKPTKGESLSTLISNLTYSGYTSEFTKNLLENETTSINDTRIPMWGICTAKLEKGKATSAPIAVIRSMAKVVVKLSASGYTLNGVTLTHANQGGTLAAGGTQAYTSTPKSETTENEQGESEATTYNTYTTNWNTDTETPITSPNIPSGVGNALTNLSFESTTEEGFVIYVPEYKNIATSEGETVTPASMTLSIKKGNETRSYTLHFADYSDGATPDGAEWDIIRNDIYEYTITGITETGGLEANVRVMPWTYETMSYELSQEAEVKLLSEPQAVFNETAIRWSNEVVYSDTDNESNYATFKIKIDEPKGVRWQAHLTNPYYFAFTSDSETYGFGGTMENGEDKVYTITVKPREQFTEVLETDLFFTVETLIDATPQINPVDENGKYVTGNYGIANNRIHIVQVKTRTGSTDDTVPFTVDMSTWGAAVLSGDNKIAGAKTGYYSYSGLSYPTGIETKTIYTGAEGAMCNNGVVMAAYNGTLYCMWQTSAQKEDTPDTHIHYSTSTDGTTWTTPTDLTTSYGYDKGYTSSGGWLVADDKLIAYVNTWTGTTTITGNPTSWDGLTKPSYGYTRYIDMSNKSTISEVTMDGGSTLTAIFEQDPHVITLPNGTKRIINAGHFQNATIQGTSYTNGLYVNPIYTDYSTDGISGWKKATFSASAKNSAQEQSREMEPSMFRKANGDLVMIFRDNEAQDAANRRVRASVSHDYGLTWSDPVATNLYDSKSKQCAGNLPDGTAFIVNNPVQSETRSPLVIHLSKDGETFNQSYLLRTGYTQTEDVTGGIQNRKGSAGSGYCYPKAMVHGDYLYVSYSTNKEDVEYTRIPLSSIQLNDPTAR